MWLQNLREQQQEGSRSGRLEALLHNFRLGRLLHLRIRKVSRHHILDSAMAALFRHAHSKSVLEVEFESEEGTGLGPTLEFFSLIAAELQRKDLAMWICDDQQIPSRTDMVKSHPFLSVLTIPAICCIIGTASIIFSGGFGFGLEISGLLRQFSRWTLPRALPTGASRPSPAEKPLSSPRYLRGENPD